MALHPKRPVIAVGDRVGRIHVYNLDSMTLEHSTQAHSAEILCMHYSPPLRCSASIDESGAGTEGWEVDLPEVDPTTGSPTLSADGGDNNSDSVDDTLVMLATAGRDRLIHVFDASSGYKPTLTLDNHSSSVTVVKWGQDGRRLISCGGDKTMVFSSVNGPEIKRLKCISVPHGTINGLSIEPTNKFLLTSGQDKRINIWNLQTGKHMRSYKSDSVRSELYKSDVDPSGEGYYPK